MINNNKENVKMANAHNTPTKHSDKSKDWALIRQFLSLHAENDGLKAEVNYLQSCLRDLLIALDADELWRIADEHHSCDSWSVDRPGGQTTQILCKKAQERVIACRKASKNT
jgi:hypothetical protein